MRGSPAHETIKSGQAQVELFAATMPKQVLLRDRHSAQPQCFLGAKNNGKRGLALLHLFI